MVAGFDLSSASLLPESVAEQAVKDKAILQSLLDGISAGSKKMQVREISFKALLVLSHEGPDVLFPHWGYLVGLLGSDNAFTKYAAIHIIAALVPADEEGRFAGVFNTYFDLLDDESVMVASHAAGQSGRIAKAKPDLQSDIVDRLLGIEQAHFDQGRKDLIKSYAIAAFDAYFAESDRKAEILAFVQRQVDCTSPKTRKAAKAFLKKWGVPG
jgi:hypothetical protein